MPCLEWKKLKEMQQSTYECPASKRVKMPGVKVVSTGMYSGIVKPWRMLHNWKELEKVHSLAASL